METGPGLKSHPKDQRSGDSIMRLIVQLVIHSKSTTPASRWEGLVCRLAGHSNE